jgi:hypothetical protein
MKTSRKLSRRSFLTRVAGGAVVGGGALVMMSGKAQAQVTDSDSGPRADGAGHGRGSNHIRGCTDNDTGSNADQAGNGRGNRVSDSDSGPNADPANCGRGRR